MIGVTRTLIITPKFFKDNYFPNDNCDDKTIRICIRRAQDLYLEDLIGTPLYSKVCQDVITMQSGGTINSDYQTLIDDYITPTIMEYTAYQYLIYGDIKMNNKGIQTQSGENSEPVTETRFQLLRKDALANAKKFGDKLTHFLNTYPQLFIEYRTISIGDTPPAIHDKPSMIFIPNGNRIGGTIRYTVNPNG